MNAKTSKRTEPVDLYTAMAIDLDAEEKGRWYNNFLPGLDLLVARHNNPAYQRMFSKLLEEAQLRAREEGTGELESDETEGILVQCMAQTILVGWRGMRYKGEDIEYTPEMALTILATPEMREFRDRIWVWSQRLDNFLKGRDKADAGN